MLSQVTQIAKSRKAVKSLACAGLYVAVLIGVGIGVVVGPLAMTAIMVAGFGLTLVIGAADRIDVLAYAVVFLLALVPVYWVPYVAHVQPLPGLLILIASAVVIAARSRSRGNFTLTSLDRLVATLFLAFCASLIAHERPVRDLLTELVQWGIPYVGMRTLIVRGLRVRTLVAALARLGWLLSVLALFEAGANQNVFQRLDFNSAVYAVWGIKVYRFGILRASASFGDPIALAMFLGTCFLCSLVLGLDARTAAGRRGWFIGGAVTFLGVGATVSKTGFVLMIAAGVLGILWLAIGNGSFATRLTTSRILLIGFGLVVVGIVISPQTRSFVFALFGSESSATGQTQTRSSVLSGRFFSWLGERDNLFAAAGITTVDNTYALLLAQWGVFATFLFAGAVVPMLAFLRRRGLAGMDAGLVILTTAQLVALAFVAPITQEQGFVFLLLGAVSGVFSKYGRRTEKSLTTVRVDSSPLLPDVVYE